MAITATAHPRTCTYETPEPSLLSQGAHSVGGTLLWSQGTLIDRPARVNSPFAFHGRAREVKRPEMPELLGPSPLGTPSSTRHLLRIRGSKGLD